ncbi:MAG TPA: hypothetical protein VH437_11545 [Terriglobales bacterium]
MPETNYVRLKDEAVTGVARRGSVLIVVGRVLLWMDFLLVMFVYVGLRGGSRFWMWWVISEALLALVLIAVGTRMRARVQSKETYPRRAA